MADRLPPGPYRQIVGSDGKLIPYYIIPFDKFGNCIGPRTREHLLKAVKDGEFTDLFLFSHGWNNNFIDATSAYEKFIDGFVNMRQQNNLPVPDGFKPLLVGIFWPSTILVFGGEQGPQFAGSDPRVQDPEVADYLRCVEAIAELTAPEKRSRFYELAQSDGLTKDQAHELAELILALPDSDNEEVQFEKATVEQLIEAWQFLEESHSTDASDFADFGTAAPVAGGSDQPGAAGIGDFFKRLDPRRILRLPTVWMMKDRAGTVGSLGVGPLLREFLQTTEARIHMIGHSYGGKVVLSATCFGNDLPRPVESMLLLQPAVSHLAFASPVPGTNRPGGYHDAPNRVKQPILSTYSKHDVPLTKAFHFAVRRQTDLGELKIAAAQGRPPSPYAALGGFGPRHAHQQLIDVEAAGTMYQLDQNVPIYGIDASPTIGGHGDINNPSTWWMLYNLIKP